MTELFLALGLLLLLLVFPIWTIARIVSLGRASRTLREKADRLEREIAELRPRALPPAAPPGPPAAPATVPAGAAVVPHSIARPSSVGPALAPARETVPPPSPAVPPLLGALQPATIPAADSPPMIPPAPPLESPPPAPTLNWEQFMGAKLFAWLGGLAGLLGLGFFVKYSFDHDLVPPEVRVAVGFLVALGLVIGGLRIDRIRYAITAQTLIATGIVSLYTVTFACRSVYHFEFFGTVPTFLLMVLITGTAFLLAVRLEAHVVAVLGMLGGFLTPVLVSTGQDNPPGLFGYIALLDLGLAAVALHRRWSYLVSLGAAGTIVTQIGWANQFFTSDKAVTAVIVCLAFAALFLAASLMARRRFTTGLPHFAWSAGALAGAALGFALYFLDSPAICARPGLLFTLVFAADACLLAIAWCEEALPRLHLGAGLAVFLILALWTGGRLTTPLLPWALAAYLLFAVLHTAFPLLLERCRQTAAPTWWSQIFPPATLLLMLLPLFRLDTVSLLLWPCVLLVDLLAIGLALLTASLATVGAVLVLTLVATGAWVFQSPASTVAAPALLVVVGGFAVLFFAAGIFLARQLGERLSAGEGESTSPAPGRDSCAQIPAFAALLPFVLLIMITARLGVTDPSPVFGLALLLAVMVLGLTAILIKQAGPLPSSRSGLPSWIEWLPACALIGVTALEYAWRARHFAADHAALPLAWFLGFFALFAAYPFIFRPRFAARTGPWAVAAFGGVLQFPLVHRLVLAAWPNDFPGLLPALFALPPLLSLIAILRSPLVDERARLNQLAVFGGVTLLFITLIFPIQFERQWITIGWALEGAALLWLFHRVPHPGLRLAGAVLLATAFARLALNPAVFAYHPRSDTAILNWYLYSYGLVTACLFAGARLLAAPAAASRPSRLGFLTRPALFNTLGTILAFLLLNLEIADFFSEPGQRVLTFKFSGHFGRDMTYTIAWALFALGLLLVGIAQRLRAGRRAALALLGVALLKLFLHDLARLDALYRIGALLAVAVVAILASFAYQRFLPANETNPPPTP